MKKSKGYMGGGKMKTKGMMAGGKTKMKSKGYASGGKAMPMAEKDGEMVPAFLAQEGGKMPNKMRMGSKMYANGGVAKIQRMEGGGKVRGSGMARNQKFGRNG